MIRVDLIGGDALVSKLSLVQPKLHAALLASVMRASIMVQNRAKQKLSGDVLRVRTGSLRSSINQAVSETADGKITGTVGSGVKYARYQEYGFTGVIDVRAYLRRTKGQMTTARRNAHGETTSSKLQGKGTGLTNVSAHQRHVNYPAHSFLRSSLRELTPSIQAEINNGIASGIKL